MLVIIVSLFSFVPVLGLFIGVFSIISNMKSINSFERNNKPYFISLVISILGLLFQVFIIINLLSYFSLSVK